ncbi:unnamed protein product [Meganyctiphanes norvegica]|uniref:Uncharacterized protein n=1 Tax=Meganyctiphanes norvegica TaxID=48144 RepID=A0AAV2R112_MEGNR
MAMWLKVIIFIAFLSIPTHTFSYRGDNHNENCEVNNTDIICDFKGEEMEIDKHFVNTFHGVSIKNCKKLVVKTEILLHNASTGPYVMSFENIDDLQLNSRSFALDLRKKDPQLLLQIINSKITELPSNLIESSERTPRIISRPKPATTTPTPIKIVHEGKLKVLIQNCTIKKINKNLINKFTILSFKIKDSHITEIDTSAVDSHLEGNFSLINNVFERTGKNSFILNNMTDPQQKLHMDSLMIINNIFVAGPLSTIIDAEIDGDANITGNYFPKLNESPWKLDVAKEVIISNNTFENVPEDGINVRAERKITIEKNYLLLLEKNCFRKINPKSQQTDLKILRNNITDFESNSLMVNDNWENNDVFIKDNIFKIICRCNISQTIKNGINSTLEVRPILDTDAGQWLKNSYCLKKNTNNLVPLSNLFVDCGGKGQNTKTKAMSVLYAFIGIIIVVAIVVLCKCLKHRQQKNDPLINSEYQSFSQPGLSIVMPEQRTYQETEIHVLFDQAEEIDNCPAKENDAGPQYEREPGDGEEEIQDKVKELSQELPKRDPSPLTRQSCPPAALGHENKF